MACDHFACVRLSCYLVCQNVNFLYAGRGAENAARRKPDRCLQEAQKAVRKLHDFASVKALEV